MLPRTFGVALALCALACDAAPPDELAGFEDLALARLDPGTVLPGSELVLAGAGFVEARTAESRLRFIGMMAGHEVDLVLPARFVAEHELRVDWLGGFAMGLPADDGELVGEAWVEVVTPGGRAQSRALLVALELRPALAPRFEFVQSGLAFVNDPIAIEGAGLLLGGAEGFTVAVVAGCFMPNGSGDCTPVGPVELPVTPETRFDRAHGTFPFGPALAGIHPGRFDGVVSLLNRHGSSDVLESASLGSAIELLLPTITDITPEAASLGQYVDFIGGGFIGPTAEDPAALTLLEFDGEFTPFGAGSPARVRLTLVPEFVAGPLVRYVLSEEDELGQLVDLRRIAGRFDGDIRPIVQHGTDTVTGTASPVRLELARLRQVVWLSFLPSYVDSLRHFGLRAVDRLIRERVLEVARRDYAGVNVDFRLDEPTDFALYARVDLGGQDPNGLGLLGYDNSHGKDRGNERLYDRIGGVNATTQEDGFPGYGGVFVESLFAFSEHPGSFATRIDGAHPLFDRVFDPFRTDRDGRAVRGDEAGALARRSSGAGCDAVSERGERIACAIWVLGSMIGTIMTHEVGHSLGLANPEQEDAFHNPGDQPARLMDTGSARSFLERAELLGEGPARFCDEEMVYLHDLLPSDQPLPDVARPGCN
ncbi:MAG: hypothetical protein EXR73_09205 [Myxococcales bacterium]|nr:hypothetical protein [Myxococcales bacterium]